MKTIHQLLLSISILLTGLVTTAQGLSIQLVTTFDYPGAVNTTPIGINDRGEVSGYYVDASNVTRGFIRTRNGAFLPPIVEPNDTGNSTRGQKINNSRVLCGFYLKVDNSNHGFFLSGNTFTEFDVAGATSTFVFALNDAGNFVGSFSTALGLDGYVNIGGTTTPFSLPGSTFTEPLAINNAGEVVGFYLDSNVHGFFRDASGAVTSPLDIPGSTLTLLSGINDAGRMTGSYTDSAGVNHGFLLTLSGSFLSYDYPGAISTGLNAISNSGLVCGRYTDTAGIPHGFIARSR